MGPLQGLSRKHVVPRAAIIDLGTNTFHLLVIDKTPDGNWKKIKVIRKTVKLGKGGLKDGIIAPAAFERGLNVLGHFSQLIDAYSPDDVIALATSGIRSTSNGVDFIRHVKKLTGINIRVIDGVQEASFILDGVRQTLPEHLGRVLIMDIGGGSTEFIIADRSKTFFKRSFPIGASRMKELFNPSDPITRSELSALKNHFKMVLSSLFVALNRYHPEALVGSSGSFETFSAMISANAGRRNRLSADGFVTIPSRKLEALHKRLLRSNSDQRRRMKGLVSMRLDMIVLASISTSVVTDCYTFKKIYASSYALKEGVAIRWARKGKV